MDRVKKTIMAYKISNGSEQEVMFLHVPLNEAQWGSNTTNRSVSSVVGKPTFYIYIHDSRH